MQPDGQGASDGSTHHRRIRRLAPIAGRACGRATTRDGGAPSLVAAEVTRGSERPPSDVRADREDAEFVSISAPRLPPRFTRSSPFCGARSRRAARSACSSRSLSAQHSSFVSIAPRCVPRGDEEVGRLGTEGRPLARAYGGARTPRKRCSATRFTRARLVGRPGSSRGVRGRRLVAIAAERRRRSRRRPLLPVVKSCLEGRRTATPLPRARRRRPAPHVLHVGSDSRSRKADKWSCSDTMTMDGSL